jgi:MFS family permease
MTNLVIDLNTDLTTIQSIIAMYSIMIASFMLIGSKLQDMIGRKKSFLIGAVFYGVGAFISFISFNSFILLIGWAILEGIGTALMIPATTTIIGNSYSGKDKLLALGIWGGIAALGSAFGPIIGGIFTSYISWRLIFVFELLFVFLVLFLSSHITNFEPALKLKDFDYIGAILSVVSLFTIVLGILMISTLDNWEIVSFILGLGLILLIIFFFWEIKAKKRGIKPISDISLLKNRTFSIGISGFIFQQIFLAGFLFVMPVFLQQVAGLDAFTTGLILLPYSFSVLIFSLIGAKISYYIMSKYMIIAGFLLASIGVWVLGGEFSVNMDPWSIIPVTIMIGSGLGLVFSQLPNYIMSYVDENKSSDAAGLLNTFRNLGYSMGTAIIGVLLIVGVIGGLTTSIEDSNLGVGMSEEQILDEIVVYFKNMQTDEDMDLPQEVIDEIPGILDNTITIVMNMVFSVLAIILAIGALLSSLLPKKKTKNDIE